MAIEPSNYRTVGSSAKLLMGSEVCRCVGVIAGSGLAGDSLDGYVYELFRSDKAFETSCKEHTMPKQISGSVQEAAGLCLLTLLPEYTMCSSVGCTICSWPFFPMISRESFSLTVPKPGQCRFLGGSQTVRVRSAMENVGR